VLHDPATVLPAETVDTNRTIQLRDTALELSDVGLNHSDSSLVMRLPKEKIIFAVDFIRLLAPSAGHATHERTLERAISRGPLSRVS
jgi:hypothetical protein